MATMIPTTCAPIYAREFWVADRQKRHARQDSRALSTRLQTASNVVHIILPQVELSHSLNKIHQKKLKTLERRVNGLHRAYRQLSKTLAKAPALLTNPDYDVVSEPASCSTEAVSEPVVDAGHPSMPVEASPNLMELPTPQTWLEKVDSTFFAEQVLNSSSWDRLFAAFDTPSTSGNAMDVDMEYPMKDEGGPWRIASNRRTVKSVNRRRQEKMEEQGILTEQDNPSSLPFG